MGLGAWIRCAWPYWRWTARSVSFRKRHPSFARAVTSVRCACRGGRSRMSHAFAAFLLGFGVRTAIVLLFVTARHRLRGKGQIGQMNIYEQVMAALRQHGLCDPTEAKLVVLEVDGSLSVVPRDAPSHRTRRHFRALRLP